MRKFHLCMEGVGTPCESRLEHRCPFLPILKYYFSMADHSAHVKLELNTAVRLAPY